MRARRSKTVRRLLRSPHSTRRILRNERLEDRQLMAGDFTASSSDIPLTNLSPVDSTFGDAGVVRLEGFVARAVEIQADGKVLAAGRIGSDTAIVRFHANGSLDHSFDNDGIVQFDFGEFPRDNIVDYATSIAFDADGDIVLAGVIDSEMPTSYVARFQSDGSLDASFGNQGQIELAPDQFTHDLASQLFEDIDALADYHEFKASDVIVQGDEIVVIGNSRQLGLAVGINASFSNFARLTTDGQLTDATRHLDNIGIQAAVEIGDDLLLVGHTVKQALIFPTNGPSPYTAVRSYSNDFDFAGYGPGDEIYGRFRGATAHPDLGLVSVGFSGGVEADGYYGYYPKDTLVHTSSGSSIDSWFVNGQQWAGGYRDVAATPDGGLVAVGIVTPQVHETWDAPEHIYNSDARIAIGLYDQNLQLQTDFGNGGQFVQSLGDFTSANFVNVDSGNGILVAGQVDGEFFLSRYLISGISDPASNYDRIDAVAAQSSNSSSFDYGLSGGGATGDANSNISQFDDNALVSTASLQLHEQLDQVFRTTYSPESQLEQQMNELTSSGQVLEQLAGDIELLAESTAGTSTGRF